jgi:hypothetical protein
VTAEQCLLYAERKATAKQLSKRYRFRPVRLYRAVGGPYYVRLDQTPLAELDGERLELLDTFFNGHPVQRKETVTS